MNNPAQEHIDHELRRRKLARIAAEVIAREGVDSATVRHIAAQAGCSTTLITDCFDDKRDLLVSAYRLVSTDTLSRFEQRVTLNPGEILDSLVATSAIDKDSWCGWRVHVAFWEKAFRDPVLATEQRTCIATARRCIEDAIKTAYGANGDASSIAQVVIALIHGISIQVLFEKPSWSHEQIRLQLSREITMAIGDTAAAHSRKIMNTFG